jgi:hypothetical protein
MGILILWMRILVHDKCWPVIEKQKKEAYQNPCCKRDYFNVM